MQLGRYKSLAYCIVKKVQSLNGIPYLAYVLTLKRWRHFVCIYGLNLVFTGVNFVLNRIINEEFWPYVILPKQYLNHWLAHTIRLSSQNCDKSMGSDYGLNLIKYAFLSNYKLGSN